MSVPAEQAALDFWYCIGAEAAFTADPRVDRLLGHDLIVGRDRAGGIVVNEREDGRSTARPSTLRHGLDDARRPGARRRRHSRGRRARPAARALRFGRGARIGAPHRREFPRHGALPLCPHRHSRRRAAHRGAPLHDRDPPRRRRGVGDQLPVLPAEGRHVGDRRHHDPVHLSGRDALRDAALQDLPELRRPLGRHLPVRPAARARPLPGASGDVPARRRGDAWRASSSSSSSSSFRTASSSRTSGRASCRSSRAPRSRPGPTPPRSPIAGG